LKIATIEDFDEIKRMGLNFLEASPYKEYYSEEAVMALIHDTLESSPTERVIIIKPGEGFVVGMVTPFLFGTDPLATEIAWWVEPDKRGDGVGAELHQALEYWAKNIANCKFISMASLDETVEEYYKKNGYKLYERAYMKVL
jgi:RimJ/RimL family protein N-acetyltransferase